MKRLIISTTLAFALLGSTGAQAATVTLGSPLTNPNLAPTPLMAVTTITQTALPGATLVSPFNGTITSWRVLGASGGPFKLRVVRPGGGLFGAAGTATSGPITGTGLLTFQANLPIKAGDMIGLDNAAVGNNIGVTAAGTPSGANFASFVPPLVDGETGRAPASTAVRELGFNATVESNCIVPNVVGKNLTVATTAIEAANCDLGKVTKPKKKKARKRALSAKKKGKLVVRSQSPAAGGEVQGGTDVALTLGKKKKKKK